jgi:hypothetical protein
MSWTSGQTLLTLAAAVAVCAYQGGETMRKLVSLLVLLAIAGVGRAGEKDILKRIVDKGGFAKDDGKFVLMPDSTTDADLTVLRELRGLKYLGLGKTKVTDEGLKIVASLPGLNELFLPGTAITDQGLRHLESASGLQFLNVDKCANVTNEGVARLQNALPKCEIRR